MKNFFKPLIIGIKRLFLSEYEIDNKLVRRHLYNFFYMKEWPHATSITDVKVFKTKKGIKVQITTHRPGLLIGKAGTFINGLRDFLNKELFSEIDTRLVEIDLKETRLWHNLY